MRSAGLTQITWRQNQLTDVSSWESCSCKAALEDLEFRDNQIEQVCACVYVMLHGPWAHGVRCRGPWGTGPWGTRPWPMGYEGRLTQVLHFYINE